MHRQDLYELVKIALTLMSIALTLASIGIAVTALCLTYRHFSASRAASLVARFSTADFLPVRRRVELFLTSIRNLPREEQVSRCQNLCRRTEEVVDDFNCMHAFGMVFVEIGVCIRSNLILRREFAAFDRIVPYYWEEFVPFILGCHLHFKFELNEKDILKPEKLRMFRYFCYAYLALRDVRTPELKEKGGGSNGDKPLGGLPPVKPSDGSGVPEPGDTSDPAA